MDAENGGLVVTIRGCTYNEERIRLWHEVARWKDEEPGSPDYRTSYIELKADRNNRYDPNAIRLLCRGEAFGLLGFVAKEETDAIRALLPSGKRSLGWLDCEVLDWGELGKDSMHVLVK